MPALGSSELGGGAFGGTLLQGMALGSTLLWENWKLTTGSLIKKTFGYSTTREGLFYDSGKVPIGKTIKIEKFNFYSKIYRDDTGGRISGRFEIYGYKADGSSVKIVDYLNKTPVGSGEWDTVFSYSINNSNEFTHIQYKFYVNDTIWRTYHTTMWVEISQWQQKGA